jgi:hypothetical protein
VDYKSKLKILGLPLIHITTGECDNKGVYRRGVAKGWIAMGDIAFGVLFSAGGGAIGGIAIGGGSLGIFSFGGVALGLFALGGLAIGYSAIGGCAIAYSAAYGGAAVALKYAVGGGAVAPEANTEMAKHFLSNSVFFKAGEAVMRHSRWFLLLVLIPIVLPVLIRKQKK